MKPYSERQHDLITTALTFYDDERGVNEWLDVLTETLTTVDKPDQCDRCSAAGDCSPRYPFMRDKAAGVWLYICYRCAHKWECSWGPDSLALTISR